MDQAKNRLAVIIVLILVGIFVIAALYYLDKDSKNLQAPNKTEGVQTNPLPSSNPSAFPQMPPKGKNVPTSPPP